MPPFSFPWTDRRFNSELPDTSRTSRIEIESFCDGSDLSEPLTRFKFEELNEDLFKRCLPIVQRVIDDSGVAKKWRGMNKEWMVFI